MATLAPLAPPELAALPTKVSEEGGPSLVPLRTRRLYGGCTVVLKVSSPGDAKD